MMTVTMNISGMTMIIMLAIMVIMKENIKLLTFWLLMS